MDETIRRSFTLLFAATLWLHPTVAQAHTTAQSKAIIAQEVRRAGGTDSSVRAALQIAYHESSFRDTARNGSCMGLYQLLLRRPGLYPWYDPVWNVRRADRYAKSRYGGWERAWAFWQRRRWW